MHPERRAPRPRRRSRRGRAAVLLALAVVLLWAGGLAWFATRLPTAATEDTRPTDAIVVLTGGSGRVQRGLALLAEKRAEKLFVSGVYRGVDVQQLLEVSQKTPQELACCITLGYEADNTRGNAAETAVWMRAEGLRSLRLVTSAYHMPRSLLEFRRAMPEIEIVAHPVLPHAYARNGWWPWPARARVIVNEYSKYLIAYLRGIGDEGTSVAAP